MDVIRCIAQPLTNLSCFIDGAIDHLPYTYIIPHTSLTSQSLQDDASSSFWSQDPPHLHLALHFPHLYSPSPPDSLLFPEDPLSSWPLAKGVIISPAFVWNLKTPTNPWFGSAMGLGLLPLKRASREQLDRAPSVDWGLGTVRPVRLCRDEWVVLLGGN